MSWAASAPQSPADLHMDLPMLSPPDSPRSEVTDDAEFRNILESAAMIHAKLRGKSLRLETENRRLKMELFRLKEHANLIVATPRPEQSPKSMTPAEGAILSIGPPIRLVTPTAGPEDLQVITDVLGENDTSCQISPASPRSPTLPHSWDSRSRPTIRRKSIRRPSLNSESSTLSLSLKHQQKAQDDRGHAGGVARLLHSVQFETAIACFITLNTITLCCECQYVGLGIAADLKYPGHNSKSQNVWPGAETAFNFLDWFFGIVFFVEMVVKLACFRIKYFYDDCDQGAWNTKAMRFAIARVFSSLQGWNIVDFLTVAAFFFDKMASSSSVVKPQMLRLLRLFRIFRLVRLVRFLESFDHLYTMTTAITGLTKVLAWAIALLTALLLACNLLLVQILQQTYFHHVSANDLSPEQLGRHHEMYAYFGTSTRCMLSMFEVTLGNWPPVVRLLSEEVSEWFTLVCLIHKLTIGFAVVGVITGVILQETFKVAQTDDLIMLRQKQRQIAVMRKKMDLLFSASDSDGDGQLDVSEFCKIGADPEIKLWLASLDIETDDLKTLFELIDEDDSGFITSAELFARMPRIKGAARGIDVMAMKRELCKVTLNNNSWPGKVDEMRSASESEDVRMGC